MAGPGSGFRKGTRSLILLVLRFGFGIRLRSVLPKDNLSFMDIRLGEFLCDAISIEILSLAFFSIFHLLSRSNALSSTLSACFGQIQLINEYQFACETPNECSTEYLTKFLLIAFDFGEISIEFFDKYTPVLSHGPTGRHLAGIYSTFHDA